MAEKQPPPSKSGFYWVWTWRNPREPVLWRYVTTADVYAGAGATRALFDAGQPKKGPGVWRKHTTDALKSTGGEQPDAWVGPVKLPARPKKV